MKDFKDKVKEVEERVKQRFEAEKKRKKEEFEDNRATSLEIVHDLAEDVVDITRYRNERSIMALPLFSTRCTKRSPREVEPMHKEMTTAKGTKRFTVTPDPRLGMPDEVDANILRFAISKGREVRYQTGYFPDHIDTTRYELCRVLELCPTGPNYISIIERLRRLASTRFEGNIFSFNEKERYCGMLVSFRYVDESKSSSPIRIEFTLSFRKHLEQEDVCLTIPDKIMSMQSPLQIRLLELVGLRIGQGHEWIIGLEKLRQECNVPDKPNSLKRFKEQLVRLELPYKVDFSKERKLVKQKVRFRKVTDVIVP